LVLSSDGISIWSGVQPVQYCTDTDHTLGVVRNRGRHSWTAGAVLYPCPPGMTKYEYSYCTDGVRVIDILFISLTLLCGSASREPGITIRRRKANDVIA
jgi:hypothetical protein